MLRWGVTNATTSVTAFALDLDFMEAYWIVAGIAGVIQRMLPWVTHGQSGFVDADLLKKLIHGYQKVGLMDMLYKQKYARRRMAGCCG